MARDIGPELLADLDRQLQDGEMDQYAYEARRVEVLELIRKGKAVERSAIAYLFHFLAIAILVGVAAWAIFMSIRASYLPIAITIAGPTLLAGLIWWRVAFRKLR
ncbi:MAG: hypothetical protein QM804_01110 [Propionicimonas sp.]